MKIKPAILICEADGRKRSELSGLLKLPGTSVATAAGFSEALALLRTAKPWRIFVLNLAALGGTPVKSLGRLKKDFAGLAVVGLGRIRDPRSGIAILERGLLDHIAAPGDALGLYSAVRNELARSELRLEKDHYEKRLQRLRIERAETIRKTVELEALFDSTVENLMTALDLRDVETYGHSQTVAKYSQILAGLLGIEDEARVENIRKGAILHDIGKIAIPDSILKKPGSLSAEEWTKVKLHPWLGYGLVKATNLPPEAGNIILCHHERFDGSGYPQGLSRDAIPLEARIFSVADSLDAITAHRPYRLARDFEAAQAEILKNSGTQFDPDVAAAFGSLKPEKWERVRFETTSLLPRIEEFSLLDKKDPPAE